MTKFSVPTMHCGHCKAKIEDAVLDADEGALLTFDMDAREIEIDSTLDPEALAATITESGYEAKPLA